MEAWVIVETNFEYDDSRYYESGSLPPTRVFLKKARAEEECCLMLHDFYKNRDIGDFVQDLDDFITRDGQKLLLQLAPIVSTHMEIELDAELDKKDPDDVPFDTYSALFTAVVKNTDLSNLSDVLDHVVIRPYKVTQVELED